MDKKKVTIETSPTETKTEIDTEYKDNYFVSIGLEYRIIKPLAVRAGVFYEPSPTKDEGLNPVVDPTYITPTFGIAYDIVEQVEFTVGAMYFMGQEREDNNIKYNKKMIALISGLRMKF